MKMYDLTHPFREGMPFYPGKRGPQIKQDALYAKNHYREKELTFLTHTGTHVDAPAHMTEKGLTLDKLPVSTFFGPAVLLDFSKENGETVELDHILPLETDLAKADFLLLATGWDRYWGEQDFYSGYPCFSTDAAKYLTQFTLKGIGMDTISADPSDSKDFVVHKTLLGAGLIIVENLCGLADLKGISPDRLYFSALPLAIEGGDGSPVRAAGIEL